MFGLVSRAEMNNTMRLLEEKIRSESESRDQRKRGAQPLQLTGGTITVDDLVAKIVEEVTPQILKQVNLTIDQEAIADRLYENIDLEQVFDAVTPKVIEWFKDESVRAELLDRVAETYVTDYLSNNELDDGIIEIISERIHVSLVNQSKQP